MDSAPLFDEPRADAVDSQIIGFILDGAITVHEEDSEVIKQHEIRFVPLHPEPDQAHSAALLLREAEGIREVIKTSLQCLAVTYDLRRIDLRTIEDTLIESGLHLDNGLLSKLKRALIHYMEETQRANLVDDHEIKATRDVFINRYGKLPHGCRDKRPKHWREYL